MKRFDGTEVRNLKKVIRDGILCSAAHKGEFTRTFEKVFAEKFGSKYAVSMNSATACLHACLIAIGIEPGDEVIVDPIMKFAATSVLHANAVPVFADIDRESFLVTPEYIENRVTERTKAIICTALFGLMPDLKGINEVSKKYDLKIIEDCAQAICAKQNDRFAGTTGDIGIFSFQESKHMTTGDGGMIVTDNERIRDNLFSIREHGWLPESALYTERKGALGWMYRMTELQSAVGLAQFHKIDALIARHREVGELLNKAVEGIEWIIPQKTEKNFAHVYWIWSARITDKKKGEKLKKFLGDQNSSMRFGYHNKIPVYLSEMFRKLLSKEKCCPVKCPFFKGNYDYSPGLCKNAEEILPEMIYLKIKVEKSVRFYARERKLLQQIRQKLSTVDGMP